jgi:hypothetical protein
MKKLIVSLLLISLSVITFSQGVFRPVPADLFKANDKALNLKAGTTTHVILWRFDATVVAQEVIFGPGKEVTSKTLSAVGPGFGAQWYVPKSDTDPTPYNIFGISGAILLGTNIYQPELESIKIAVLANAFQFFTAGVAYTPNAANKFSLLLGGQIKF